MSEQFQFNLTATNQLNTRFTKTHTIQIKHLPTWVKRDLIVSVMKKRGLTAAHISEKLKGNLTESQIRGLLLPGKEDYDARHEAIIEAIGYSECTIEANVAYHVDMILRD